MVPLCFIIYLPSEVATVNNITNFWMNHIYNPPRTHRWRAILIDPINSSQFIPFDYTADDTEHIFIPVHTFWHKDYTSDHTLHANEEGYHNIALELLKGVKSSRSFKTFISRGHPQS